MPSGTATGVVYAFAVVTVKVAEVSLLNLVETVTTYDLQEISKCLILITVEPSLSIVQSTSSPLILTEVI